jgi:hypothetical protein
MSLDLHYKSPGPIEVAASMLAVPATLAEGMEPSAADW